MKHIIRAFIRIISFLKKRIRRLFLPRDWGKIYYINGSNVLPSPMTPTEESELLDRIREDSTLKKVLVERNLRLAVYIAKKFESTGINIEDLISIGTVGLMKAANTFAPEKNIKLATYASRCIENEILMYIRKNSAQKREISIDEPLDVDWDGNELLLSDVLGSDADVVCRRIEEVEEKRMVRQSVAGLAPREREIIELRFGLAGGRERTQKEVADLLGISQSYISRLEKKIMERLRLEMSEKL